jgi:predicted RNase H-like nuclease (RuvC/YqgF family)
MKQHGLNVSGKLFPLVAAEACAILASRKLGYIVEPFENETKIIVSRSRSKGSGGWSQKRYSRLYDTAINQEAKKIESNFIERRFDFDKNVTKSKFGAQKVVFSVYSPISEITKIVKKRRGELCRVNIHPVNKERVEFIPLSQQVQTKSSLRRLIVGIDPGLTIGLSIMDLNGRILKISSYREASRGQIIREITNYGKPSLICVDVYPYPAYVEKISAVLNSRLYTPRSVMTVSEKNEISRKLAMQQGVNVKNAHQRDSLASAYKGYAKFRSEFEKIERNYRDVYDKSLRDEIKNLLVKGKTLADAIEEINQSLTGDKTVKEKIVKPILKQKPELDVVELKKEFDILQEQLDWERSKNTEFYSEIKVLEEKLENLQFRLDEDKSEYSEKIQREKAYIILENQISHSKERINLLENEIERYSDRIDELKRVVWLRGHKGWVPLKVIRKFTQDEIERTAENYGLGPGDIVLLLDTTGGGGQTAEKLFSYKIKAIIGDVDHLSYNARKKLIESQVPIAKPADIEIIRIDEIAIIKEDDLNKLISEAKKEIDLIVTEKKESFLDNLIDEYRKERKIEITEQDKTFSRERRKKDQTRFEDENGELED